MAPKNKAPEIGLEIKGTTQVVGLFGDPVTYTLSPRMHNFAFARLGLDFAYLPFLVKPKNLQKAVESVRSLNLKGMNITIPHKQAVIPFLDELSPLVKKIGAVNTILNKNGKLIGHNTDCPGFIASLKGDGNFNPKGKKAVILGSGGTAHAMAVSLLDEGLKKLIIMNRTIERAQTFADHLKNFYLESEIFAFKLTSEHFLEQLEDADIFLNATPAGIESAGISALPSQFLSPNLFVFDAVYAQLTPLLLAAREAKAPFLGGLGMLIHQGALSFSLWTGAEPPVNLMKEALKGYSL